MTFSVVIPARYASTRLPGKALCDIGGRPLVQHVYEQCIKSQAGAVIIATDDQRIINAANKFNADAVLTAAHHQSGTERIAEVVNSRNIPDETLIVNVQGDEPFLPPNLIDQVAQCLIENKQCAMATLCVPIRQIADVFNPNVVKVVMDKNGKALLFSRAPVPWDRDKFGTLLKDSGNSQQYADVSQILGNSFYRHVGIYAYRAGFIREYVALTRSSLEQLEALEQLRVLFHGYDIYVSCSDQDTGIGVDTEEDLALVRKVLASKMNNHTE